MMGLVQPYLQVVHVLPLLVVLNSVHGNGAGSLQPLNRRKSSPLPGLLCLSICVFLQDRLPVIGQDSALIPMGHAAPGIVMQMASAFWRCSHSCLPGAGLGCLPTGPAW